MTIMNRQAQRVVLPKSGPDSFWETVHEHFAGSDPQLWKYLAMLVLREDCGWQFDQIGWAFGHSKGHVLRCIAKVKEQLRAKFDPPKNERDRCDPFDGEIDLNDGRHPNVE